MSTHTVSIRCRPATFEDLKDGQVLLLSILNEHGAGHQAVTIFQNWIEENMVFFDYQSGKNRPLPDFFPENCFVPCL